jgi:hypothetical protein
VSRFASNEEPHVPIQPAQRSALYLCRKNCRKFCVRIAVPYSESHFAPVVPSDAFEAVFRHLYGLFEVNSGTLTPMITADGQISDDELLIRLRNYEDNFVERKTNQGKADWLQTAVAFANAVPIGYPAVLFVGVDNKGNPQKNGDLESLQKTVAQEINRAYPPIYYLPRVLNFDGKGFIAFIVPGSPSRPHFAGKAYIRSGPETKEASERQLDSLVAERSGRVYEIRKYIGKSVILDLRTTYEGEAPGRFHNGVNLVDCNAHYVTVEVAAPSGIHVRPGKNSYPLQQIILSYDHKADTLEIRVLQR